MDQPNPNSNPETIRVIYIAGYGRSGSTLLDRILAAHPEVCGLGEVAYLADSGLADFYWDAARGIPLWDALEPDLRFTETERSQRERVQKKHESRLTGWFWWLRGASAAYQEHITSVFRTIRAATPNRVGWLVDSSKTARERFFRPFLMNRVPGLDVHVIHLVRDPRGCVNSVLAGSNAAMERGERVRWRGAVLRAAWGWTMANLSGLLFGLVHKHRYTRLRYEELAQTPAVTLRRLEEALDLDFSAIARQIADEQPIPLGEQFAGNRMRTAESLRLRPDTRWKTALPRLTQILVWLLCAPVSLLAQRSQHPPQTEVRQTSSARAA